MAAVAPDRIWFAARGGSGQPDTPVTSNIARRGGTGHPATDTGSGSTTIGGKWVIGYVGTWLILAAMAENQQTVKLASALAVSIAIGATFILLPKLASNLGV